MKKCAYILGQQVRRFGSAEVSAAEDKLHALKSDRTALERQLLDAESTIEKRRETVADLESQITGLEEKRAALGIG